VTYFAINYRPTRGTISPYNIAGLISEVSEEVATQIGKNCRCRQPHSHLRTPPIGIPCEYAHAPYNSRNLKSLAYIFVPDSMGLSSFQFQQYAPIYSSFLHQSTFWSFMVIQGQSFWYQSKARLRLPISRSL